MGAVLSTICGPKIQTSRQNHGLKFGMVGTYKSYFSNVKKKGKVIFDHSTTLTLSLLFEFSSLKKSPSMNMR